MSKLTQFIDASNEISSSWSCDGQEVTGFQVRQMQQCFWPPRFSLSPTGPSLTSVVLWIDLLRQELSTWRNLEQPYKSQLHISVLDVIPDEDGAVFIVKVLGELLMVSRG